MNSIIVTFLVLLAILFLFPVVAVLLLRIPIPNKWIPFLEKWSPWAPVIYLILYTAGFSLFLTLHGISFVVK